MRERLPSGAKRLHRAISDALADDGPVVLLDEDAGLLYGVLNDWLGKVKKPGFPEELQRLRTALHRELVPGG